MMKNESECVSLKRRGAKHVAELLSKTQKNELEFWSSRTMRLRQKQKRSKSKNLIKNEKAQFT